MSLKTPDTFYSDGECHMAEIADVATFVERQMEARGESPEAVTFDSIYASAQSKNTADNKLTYPWMDEEWPNMTSNQKIKMLNELIDSWLDDEKIILYANKVANGNITSDNEIDRQQLVSGAETLASQALDRMNANGYFNKEQK
ncbi:MAG TPA: hypothetical protein PK547_02380 [Candidatus Paceibacterota bacterium]|nr:hypothetical protein [Candidatus Paceibacterota bacterium]